MLDPNNIDFIKLGFHAGLEVHHQIKSERKLFCNCPPILEEDPENMDYSFHRYFRPVLGEMGDFDPGMLVEFEKGYKVIYFACERNTCTYEMDETPPFLVDDDAVMKGFILSALFNCSAFAEEIVVNRKQYLDGSITTGFQRTFICGRDGWVPVNGKKVRVTNVHIEEDAARRVNWIDTANRTVYFNLDRLGVPLTEVITEYTDVDTPEELIETARQIGRVLRLSGIGCRGIGSARQDVNITIAGGDRVEIKGVQDLDMFDLLCRNEVVRQHALLEIKDEMLKRNIKSEDFEHTYVDITHLFSFDENIKVFSSIFPKMKGLFNFEVQPNKDFGLEIFEKSMLITGVPRENHFHSDEFIEDSVRLRSDYPSRLEINDDKYKQICSIMNPNPEDALIVVKGLEKKAIHALKKIVERVKAALEGVPQETRRLVPNGNSEFLRVIHGKDRIYPDTDTPPIVISLEKINEYTKDIGKKPWELFDELHKKYNFTQNQVDLLIRDEKVDRFYDYVNRLKLHANLAYRILVELPREKRRKQVNITDKMLDMTAKALADGAIFQTHISDFIEILNRNPKMDTQEIVKQLAIPKIPENELDNIILSKIKSYDEEKLKTDESYYNLALPKIIGVILKEINYAEKGKVIAEKIELHLKEEEK
ncbi:MAG: Glu-tRNA(Gln) amidotransferase subunit GatE [Candidatus Thorarchaeota archaeon]